MTNEEKTRRYRALVEECLKAKRFEEAISFYRQLIDLNPGDNSYRLGLAWAYHDCGKADQAVACFEQVFEKELQRRIFTGFAFDELVRIYKESKKYDRLVDVCERAMAAQPEDVALLGELGDGHSYARITVSRILAAREAYLSGNADSLGNVIWLMKKLVEFYLAHIGREDKYFFHQSMGYLTRREQDFMLLKLWDFDRKPIHEKYGQLVERLEKEMAKDG